MANDCNATTLRDFRGRRWLSVVLRGVHLVAVVNLGASVLGTPPSPPTEVGAAAVLVSGILVWALDLWHKPGHLVEGAGLGMLLKLALVAGMILAPSLSVPLFWIVVVWSAVFSHAPASFRNARPWASRSSCTAPPLPATAMGRGKTVTK